MPHAAFPSPVRRVGTTLFVALMLLGAACRAPAPPAQGSTEETPGAPTAPPRFEDLSVIHRFDGPPATVDLDSHPRARRFRSALREGAAAGPNLAGDLTLVSWGCGTMCQQAMVLDAATGRVIVELEAPLGWEYRLDSELIVENPLHRVEESRCPDCATRHLVRIGDRLLGVPEAAFPPAGMSPTMRGLVVRQRAAEGAALADAATTVSREHWASLRFRARDGREFEIRDEFDGLEPRTVHRFAGTVEPLDAWLIQRLHVPEGGDWLLLDQGGRITVLDAEPVPDPTGQRFVTASVDLVAGHAPNRIRIYRMDSAAPAVEWEATPRDWGARAPRWTDRNTLELDRVVVRWSAHGELVSPMRVRRTEDGWEMVPDPAHAADVLRAFFDALAAGRYHEALRHYGGDYDVLRGWNPEIPPGEHASLWEAACRHNGLQCLPELEVLDLASQGGTRVTATVRFPLPDGGVFVLGPCCGATAEEMPPTREFGFRLRLEDHRWLVEDLPVYVP